LPDGFEQLLANDFDVRGALMPILTSVAEISQDSNFDVLATLMTSTLSVIISNFFPPFARGKIGSVWDTRSHPE
jgi:hypothetical protein